MVLDTDAKTSVMIKPQVVQGPQEGASGRGNPTSFALYQEGQERPFHSLSLALSRQSQGGVEGWWAQPPVKPGAGQRPLSCQQEKAGPQAILTQAPSHH